MDKMIRNISISKFLDKIANYLIVKQWCNDERQTVPTAEVAEQLGGAKAGFRNAPKLTMKNR